MHGMELRGGGCLASRYGTVYAMDGETGRSEWISNIESDWPC